jgi:cytochrome c
MKLVLALLMFAATAGQSVVRAPALPPGDAQRGATVFINQCAACHMIGPHAQNSVGPVLTGVVGRHAATYPGYSYSSAMKKSGIVWNVANVAKFVRSPQKLVRGTKMGFFGLSNDQDLADVIAYLKTSAKGNSTAQK